MALITTEIPSQAFELIRDRIVDILAEELAAQLDFNGDFNDDFGGDPMTVYAERFVPLDKTELPAISVCFSRGDFTAKDARTTDGSFAYFIEAYTGSPETEDERGDYLATVKVQRLLGSCRAILESSFYTTLGYERPFIAGIHCSDIQMGNVEVKDAIHVAMGRLTLLVRAPQLNVLHTPRLLSGYETKYKVAETEKGFLLINN